MKKLLAILAAAAAVSASAQTPESQTGTAERNQWLAEHRAENVYNILVNDYGVPASQLIRDSKGGVDYMYFDDPQLSRSVIISVAK